MKRITAICIATSFAVVSSLSFNDAFAASHNTTQKIRCPAPTMENTGWLLFDENGDGFIDRQIRVFNQGPCVAQYAGDRFQGEDTYNVISK